MALSLWGPPDQGAPQFGARVDLIRLDVSVVDKNHQPVGGLTAADFTILENGKPQSIQTFAPVVLADEPLVTAPWMRDVSADVTSNTSVDEERLVVLVMDDYSDDVSKDLFALRSVKDIARGIVDHLGPRDLAAVVYTVASKHNQEFTHDRQRLLAAVDQFDPAATLPQFSTLAVLERVCEVLGSVQERRKVVIWISPGVVPPGSNLRSVIKIAQMGNVNIYPIDPAGIRAASFETPPLSGSNAPIGSSIKTDTERMNYVDRLNLLRENMFVLANLTGGQNFQWNEFKKSINQVFRETGSFYLLGYVSSAPVVDEKLRRLEVKVNRAGLRVSARAGYFPSLGADSAVLPAPNRAALEALSGLVPVRGIPLQMTAAPFASNLSDPEGITSTVVVAIGLPAPMEGADELEILLKAFTFDGEPRQTKILHARIDAHASTVGARKLVQVVDYLELPPGRYQLRLGVASGKSQASGSVYADLDVPDFSREDLSLSGVALTDPAAKAVIGDGAQPRLPVIPTTTREFDSRSEISGFVELYQKSKSVATRVAVDLKVLDGNERIVFRKTDSVDPEQFGSTRRAPFRFEVPLAIIPAGEYLLVVEASTGVVSVHRNVRFTKR